MIGLTLTPRVPAYAITLDGKPITSKFTARLQSLTLTDRRGLEADQLDLVLTDHDGLLALPSRGAKLSLALGWTGDLVPRGEYLVDEIEHTGTPDTLTIRARSADLRGGAPLTIKRDRSYHETTLDAVLSFIAGRNNLEAVIGADLQAERIKHLDQDKESDLALITRLGEQYDAIATIKAGRLLFMRIGQGTTASGKPLPPYTYTRAAGDRHRFVLAERDAFTGVVAEWRDTAQARKHEAVARKHEAVAGDLENAKRLRAVYADQESALLAARSELSRIQRGVAALELTLAWGEPELQPEVPVTVVGLKPLIDAQRWIITQATHRLGDSGYTTELELEARLADG